MFVSICVCVCVCVRERERQRETERESSYFIQHGFEFIYEVCFFK